MANRGGLISAAVLAAVAIYVLATGELRSALMFGAVAVIGAVAVVLNRFWQPRVTLRQYLLISLLLVFLMALGMSMFLFSSTSPLGYWPGCQRSSSSPFASAASSPTSGSV